MTSPESRDYHEPVLLQEMLSNLAPVAGAVMLDATLGGGGHSAALASTIRPGGTLIGLDRDTDALQAAALQLAPNSTDLTIILLHTPFGKLEAALAAEARTQNIRLDGVLFDLGVSSHQLDTERGFSFRRDERLDMRMDTTQGETADELLARISEPEFTRILFEYGEERWAKRIAHNLIAQRARGEKMETTAQLANLVETSIPRAAWSRDIHVATRTFQSVRIAVNDELGQLDAGLQAAVARLKSGGRIAVMSYHSLEDRIVKRAFAELSGTMPSAPASSPAAFLKPDKEPVLRLLTRKPIVPTDREIASNPRARSAKMRVAEHL